MKNVIILDYINCLMLEKKFIFVHLIKWITLLIHKMIYLMLENSIDI
jgi:hypothetical protein